MKIYLTRDDILAEPWQKNPCPLRGRRGVYLIAERESGRIIYAGQSRNIGRRLSPSVHHIFNRKIHDVLILFVNNDQERYYLEGRCIDLLKPDRNIRMGYDLHYDEATKKGYYDSIFLE